MHWIKGEIVKCMQLRYQKKAWYLNKVVTEKCTVHVEVWEDERIECKRKDKEDKIKLRDGASK